MRLLWEVKGIRIFPFFQTNTLGEINLIIVNEVTKALIDTGATLSVFHHSSLSSPLSQSTQTTQTVIASNYYECFQGPTHLISVRSY